MIIRPHLHWFRMLLAWRGSVLPQLLPRLFLIFCIAIVAVAAHDHLLPVSLNLNTTTPFSLLGIALAVFLGFRNNASYDRWWEARKLWGQLLMGLKILSVTIPPGSADAHERHAGFGQAAGHQHLFAELRGAIAVPHLLGFLRHVE